MQYCWDVTAGCARAFDGDGHLDKGGGHLDKRDKRDLQLQRAGQNETPARRHERALPVHYSTAVLPFYRDRAVLIEYQYDACYHRGAP